MKQKCIYILRYARNGFFFEYLADAPFVVKNSPKRIKSIFQYVSIFSIIFDKKWQDELSGCIFGFLVDDEEFHIPFPIYYLIFFGNTKI